MNYGFSRSSKYFANYMNSRVNSHYRTISFKNCFYFSTMLTLLKQNYVPCIAGQGYFTYVAQTSLVSDSNELSAIRELVTNLFSLNSSVSLLSLLRSLQMNRNTLVNLSQGLIVDPATRLLIN